MKTVKIDQKMKTGRRKFLFLFLGISIVYIGFSFSNVSVEDTTFTSEKIICTMSYNIRFDNPEDKNFNWEDRKSLISQTISSNTPDVIGIQEAYYNQVRWLDEELKVYDWYAIGSDDGKFRGEYCAIFYNRQKFTNINSGTIWLNEKVTNAEKSVITWVQLRMLSSDEEIYVFNTRLTMEDKEKSAIVGKLMSEVSMVAGNSRFILTGDFHLEPNESDILKIKEWCKEAKENSFINSSTLDYTFIGDNGDDKKCFDYVFFSNDFPVNTYEVLNNSHKAKFPSDHLPILCKLRLP